MTEQARLLEDRAAMSRIDPDNAAAVLADFPAQCRKAARIEPRHLPAVKRPRVVVIAGMGGSAASGDLAAACAATHLEIPVLVHRGYGLPAVACDDALVIAVSYSGDTEESVSAAEAAIARQLPLVVVASGGALAALATRHGAGHVEVPGGLMPRMALGYLFFPMSRVLQTLQIPVVTPDEVAEALDEVEALGRALRPEEPAAGNEAKRVAMAIGARWPVVYGGPLTGGVAYRWKTDIEENAKTFALSGALPEMNHNTIEAWRAPRARDAHMVFLRDAAEAPQIRRRFELLQDLVGGAAGGVTTCWTRGRGGLARLLSLIYLGQWVSYYLAILRGIDPWSVPLLDEFKRRSRRA